MYCCKAMNPENKRGLIVIVVMMSDEIHGRMGSIIKKFKEKEIPVTWLINPVISSLDNGVRATLNVDTSLVRVSFLDDGISIFVVR